MAPRALAPRGAGMGPGQAGVEAALVEEDQPPRRDPGQAGVPRRAGLRDVLTVLLGGTERLSLRGKPSRRRARQIAEGLRRRPVRTANRSAYSASVASFCSAASARSTSSAPPKIGRAPSELQSRQYLVCRLLLEKKNKNETHNTI